MTDTFNLQPLITTDQAKRMELALNARQQVEEDCCQLLKDMLARSTPTMQGNRIVTAADVAEARELLADWAVHNRAFEAAVFERTPGGPAAVTGEFPT